MNIPEKASGYISHQNSPNFKVQFFVVIEYNVYLLFNLAHNLL